MSAPRDKFIGWNHNQRQNYIHQAVNYARFLILLLVHSTHLASRLLGMVSRRMLTICKITPVLFYCIVIRKRLGAEICHDVFIINLRVSISFVIVMGVSQFINYLH
jgi:hypothetical protein